MTIKTESLDRAAFFLTFGGEISKIEGKYPNNIFVCEVNKLLAAYELIGGWVPYNKFCNQRRAIKRRTRKLAGLPEYFTGNHDTGFKFGDIAMIRPKFKKEFKEKLLK